MFAVVMPTTLQHVGKTFDVGTDISVRILQGIANASLGREMNHHGKAVCREERLCLLAVGQVELQACEAGLTFQNVETRFLQLRVVIVIQTINANDRSIVRQQSLRDMKTDEAGGP